MTIYQKQFLSELAAGHDGPAIPPAKRAYFQERLRGRIFDFILGQFLAEEENGLTQAKLARRIGKTADVISRWLGAPSNMTIDTISDLLLGIGPEELELSSSPLLHRSPVNYSHLDELGSIADMSASPEQRSDKISAIDIAANELSQQQRIASIDARP